jgi:uncharacterized protein YgiM (DUF1202 family)
MHTRVLLGIAMIIAVQHMYGQIAQPIQSYKDPYFCNYSKVYNLQTDTYLSVRSGPGMKFSKIDRLKVKTVVYVCDEKSEWVQVFYSGPELPCVVDSSVGLLSSKKNTCKSGWVNRKWIDVV